MTLPDMQRMVVTQLTNKISKIISDELVVSREHNIKLGKTYYRTELHVFTNDQLREYVRKQAENLIVRSLCNL